MTPKASVIIPSYNCGGLIGRALDSVLHSGLDPGRGDLEVLVVDDGSTDDTEERVREYGQRVGYRRQENRGPAAARNAGLAATRGEIVIFLDADDEYAPDAIPTLLTAFDREPAAGWAAFHIRRRGPERDEVRRSALSATDPLEGILRRNTIERACFRRSLLEEAGGYCETLRIYEDWDLYIRLVEAARLPTLVDAAIYTYWERDASITRDRRIGRAAWRLLLRREHERIAAERGGRYRAILADQLWSLARETWSAERDLPRTGSLLWRSFRADPSAGRAWRLLRSLAGRGAEGQR